MTKLRHERVRRGLTTQDVAYLLGVSAAWVSALERFGPKKRRQRDKEDKIARIFDCPFDQLMEAHPAPTDGPPNA